MQVFQFTTFISNCFFVFFSLFWDQKILTPKLLEKVVIKFMTGMELKAEVDSDVIAVFLL